jgi:hypothetical protein
MNNDPNPFYLSSPGSWPRGSNRHSWMVTWHPNFLPNQNRIYLHYADPFLNWTPSNSPDGYAFAYGWAVHCKCWNMLVEVLDGKAVNLGAFYNLFRSLPRSSANHWDFAVDWKYWGMTAKESEHLLPMQRQCNSSIIRNYQTRISAPSLASISLKAPNALVNPWEVPEIQRFLGICSQIVPRSSNSLDLGEEMTAALTMGASNIKGKMVSRDIFNMFPVEIRQIILELLPTVDIDHLTDVSPSLAFACHNLPQKFYKSRFIGPCADLSHATEVIENAHIIKDWAQLYYCTASNYSIFLSDLARRLTNFETDVATYEIGRSHYMKARAALEERKKVKDRIMELVEAASTVTPLACPNCGSSDGTKVIYAMTPHCPSKHYAPFPFEEHSLTLKSLRSIEVCLRRFDMATFVSGLRFINSDGTEHFIGYGSSSGEATYRVTWGSNSQANFLLTGIQTALDFNGVRGIAFLSDERGRSNWIGDHEMMVKENDSQMNNHVHSVVFVFDAMKMRKLDCDFRVTESNATKPTSSLSQRVQQHEEIKEWFHYIPEPHLTLHSFNAKYVTTEGTEVDPYSVYLFGGSHGQYLQYITGVTVCYYVLPHIKDTHPALPRSDGRTKVVCKIQFTYNRKISHQNGIDSLGSLEPDSAPFCQRWDSLDCHKGQIVVSVDTTMIECPGCRSWTDNLHGDIKFGTGPRNSLFSRLSRKPSVLLDGIHAFGNYASEKGRDEIIVGIYSKMRAAKVWQRERVKGTEGDQILQRGHCLGKLGFVTIKTDQVKSIKISKD